MIKSQSTPAKSLRLPLWLLRPVKSLPILSGPLRGKKWIANSGDRSCWLGTYQKEKQALFSETISPGDVVFDIGGRVGFLALLAAKLVGKTGQVVVFEPLPRNLDYLHKHLEDNKARNVTVFEAAVSYKSDSTTEAALHPEDAEQPPTSRASQKETCTLDGLLERDQIPLPNLIHIDIGGGEFAGLCGARSLLSKAHPTIILATHGEIPHRECCAFLEMLDYSLTPIDGKALKDSRNVIATHI